MLETARRARVREIASRYAAARGPLLPALHAVHTDLGWIARSDIEELADAFTLSVAEVHGVVSFYHDLRTSAPPRHTVRICRGEACQAVGAEALAAAVRDHLGGSDGVEVAEVFCLGNCALGPSGQLDGRLHGRLTPARVAALTEQWQS